MGIYVFKREVLSKFLRESLEQTDFGKEIIPAAANDYNVQPTCLMATGKTTRHFL